VLGLLKPNFKSASTDYCKQWLRSVNNYQNTVDATISAAVKNHVSSPTSIQIRYVLIQMIDMCITFFFLQERLAIIKSATNIC